VASGDLRRLPRSIISIGEGLEVAVGVGVRAGVRRRLDKVVVERIPFCKKGEGVRVGLELGGVWIIIVDIGVDDGGIVDGVGGVSSSVGVDPRRDRT